MTKLGIRVFETGSRNALEKQAVGCGERKTHLGCCGAVKSVFTSPCVIRVSHALPAAVVLFERASFVESSPPSPHRVYLASRNSASNSPSSSSIGSLFSFSFLLHPCLPTQLGNPYYCFKSYSVIASACPHPYLLAFLGRVPLFLFCFVCSFYVVYYCF